MSSAWRIDPEGSTHLSGRARRIFFNRAPSGGRSVAAVTEIEDAQQELIAGLGGNPETLRALVSERCQVIGPKGFLLGKDEWIAAHSKDVYEQLVLESLEHDVRIYGETAIHTDLQRSECLYLGTKIAGLFRVLSAWTRHYDRCKLVAIQYTAVSPEAAVALYYD